MDVRLLQTFRAVVDHRCVMQPAAAIGVTQAAVSAQIARLEQGLSFPLFACSNERLKLPAEDAEADKVLTGMDRLCEATQQIPTARQSAGALACALQTSTQVAHAFAEAGREWLPWPKPSPSPVYAVSLPAQWVGPRSILLSASTFRHLGLVTRPFEVPSTTNSVPFARGTAGRRSCRNRSCRY